MDAENVDHGDRKTTEAAEPATEGQSGGRRMLHLLVAVLVGVVLPAVVMGALVGEPGVLALFTGALWGVLGAKLGGTRRMVYLTPLVGVVAGTRGVYGVRLVVGGAAGDHGSHCR